MPPRIETLVQHIGSLPSLPTVLLRVGELLNDPRTSAMNLSRVILEDQALTGRLLRLVNSAFYGFPRRIATITEVLNILGFYQVRNLLLSVTVMDLLENEEAAEFSPVRLWEHSVGTAVAAGLLARQLCPEDREELFVAGLLHDVGKLVEFQFIRKEFLKVVAVAQAEDLPFRAAEQVVLGFSHDRVGSLLANQWKLPIRLAEAIAYHHRPDLAQAAKREATIVHLADILCHALGIVPGGDDGVPPLDPDAGQRLRFPLTMLEPLIGELETQYEVARGLLLTARNPRPKRAEQFANA